MRPMVAADATAVSRLLPDLGYEATPADVVRRFDNVMARPDNALLVAEQNGALVGLAHVYGARLIASDGYAEIGALVVARDCLRQGIGRQLVSECEAWSAAHCYRRIRLRSGIRRGKAPSFLRSHWLRQRESQLCVRTPSGRHRHLAATGLRVITGLIPAHPLVHSSPQMAKPPTTGQERPARPRRGRAQVDPQPAHRDRQHRSE